MPAQVIEIKVAMSNKSGTSHRGLALRRIGLDSGASVTNSSSCKPKLEYASPNSCSRLDGDGIEKDLSGLMVVSKEGLNTLAS